MEEGKKLYNTEETDFKLWLEQTVTDFFQQDNHRNYNINTYIMKLQFWSKSIEMHELQSITFLTMPSSSRLKIQRVKVTLEKQGENYC